MPSLTLETANRIIAAALAKGRELNLKPLCVAVVDAGGHLLTLQREDGASNMRPQLATGKAVGALGLGVSSRKIAEIAAERPSFIASLATISQAGIIPAAGGVLATADGELVGAVGVTGDTADNDEICAMAGLSAVGLSALG